MTRGIGMDGGRAGFPRSYRRGRAGREPEEEKKHKALPLKVVLRDAAELVRGEKGRLATGFALLAVNRLCGLVLPGTTKFLLDEVIGKGNRELLGVLVLAAGAATLVQAVTSFVLSEVLGKAAQRSITKMRRRVQRHVGQLPIAFFDQTKTGALLSRVMTDAEGIRNLLGTGLVNAAGGLLTAALTLGMLLYLSVKLTVITVAVLSLLDFVLLYVFRTFRPLFRERSKINAEVSGRLTESLSGIRVVKAYHAERREALVFSKGAHRLFRNVAKTMTRYAAVSDFSTLILGIVGVGIMWIGSNDVLAGRMTLGSFFSFTLYLGMLVGPLMLVVATGSQIMEAFAGLESIREICDEKREDERDPGLEPLPRIVGHVEFGDVSFEYDKGVPVLKNVSFEAAPGTSTALVGPSGAGKSTLIGLVSAFYRPTTGVIRVDGYDLSGVRLADYRSQLGVVFQDNFLFDGTVLENIAYARCDAPREEILRAASVARCDDFVEELPDGYDTIVGERGVKLSGGQRQRVAIARAVLADPRILILDEATSSLDSQSEAAIQEGLAQVMHGRTTFVIAHRLSTIRNADTILLLEAGRIVERGNHGELLARGERYFDLYTRQHEIKANLFLNPGESPPAADGEAASQTSP